MVHITGRLIRAYMRACTCTGVVHLPPPDARQRRSLDMRPVSRSLACKVLSSGAITTRERMPSSHGLASKELRTRVWDFIEPLWCGKVRAVSDSGVCAQEVW